MISMAPNLPPVTLTDEAMKLAATLLQVASDPGGTQARLAELATATQTYRDAIAEHASAKVAADAAAAGLADLQQREQDLANRSEALAAAQTQLQVASSANAARTQALDDAQAALDKQVAAHEAKVAANEQRLAAVRASLA